MCPERGPGGDLVLQIGNTPRLKKMSGIPHNDMGKMPLNDDDDDEY